ncbi:FtsX-like permease family protein [Microbacterium sp. SYP-A9085]|uniref:permease-like cell division protein FtsX n=1 Tax=Microbacterium sp. SYP-A9085 TaxID=2664454 RepID=UPI00129AFB8D|nr:permease-like cell division protein FtsX [Microbacterium sp. SYP-A9085]MRH29653.1 FtsX-like permease family protein [Microbacterium sp. SYP-A9085]
MRAGLILGEALSGLRRNASMVISIVLVTFVSLTFVGAAMLMQAQIGTMRDFWTGRAQVQVSMCVDGAREATCVDGAATDQQIQSVRDRLDGAGLKPLIAKVRFENPEQAYKNALELLGADYKDILSPSQFGASFYVNLVDPQNSAVITEAFAGNKGVQTVQDQMQLLQPLFSALTIATYIAVGIAVLMLIAAVLLISTTIRLSAYARRKELRIMRLVGASNRFIQTPFILEGVFAALIGSILAGGAVWAAVQFGVRGYLQKRVDFITTWVGMGEVAYVIPVLVGIGVVLSAVSAGFAIRRWLRA